MESSSTAELLSVILLDEGARLPRAFFTKEVGDLTIGSRRAVWVRWSWCVGGLEDTIVQVLTMQAPTHLLVNVSFIICL